MCGMRFKIENIELTPLHVPFKDYVIKAMGEAEGGLGMAIEKEINGLEKGIQSAYIF